MRDFSLELRPFCVLLGANGSGKSSFLDAYSLLSASAAGDLFKKAHELGGMSSFATRLDDRAAEATPARVEFEISMPMEQAEPLVYKLAVTDGGIQLSIMEELTQRDSPDAEYRPYFRYEYRS